MPDRFLGLTALHWTAVEAIAVVISGVILAVAAVVAVRQLRQSARSAQFAAVNRMQQLVDDSREDRTRIFELLPAELALSQGQFAHPPPSRHGLVRISEGQRRSMLLTKAQEAALESLTPEAFEVARRVINRLNDLGQLVEDGYIPKDVFLGKYHVLVLRCCHLLEPVRRRFEEQGEGGNYGQRLLRMRAAAARYNDLNPKHRDVGVYIRTKTGRRLVYRTPQAGWFQRLRWATARQLRLY